MTIEAGYGNKPTQIRVAARPDSRTAEFWIEQEALEGREGIGTAYETLAYITLDELLDLKGEIDKAIQEIVK